MSKFNVGDRVRTLNTEFTYLANAKPHEVYTVTNVNPGSVMLDRGLVFVNGIGKQHRYWDSARFELVVPSESEVLDTFKEALANLRQAGYTVDVKVTHTITEEVEF